MDNVHIPGSPLAIPTAPPVRKNSGTGPERMTILLNIRFYGPIRGHGSGIVGWDLSYRGFITMTVTSVRLSMSQAGLTVMSQSRGFSLLLSHWATVPKITGVLRNPGFFRA